MPPAATTRLLEHGILGALTVILLGAVAFLYLRLERRGIEHAAALKALGEEHARDRRAWEDKLTAAQERYLEYLRTQGAILAKAADLLEELASRRARRR